MLGLSDSISADVTFSGCANLLPAQLPLLQSIDTLVQIQNNMGSVADEQSAISLDAMLLEIFQLLEKAWDVNDGSRADQVHAGLVNQAEAARDHMVVERPALGNDGLWIIKQM